METKQQHATKNQWVNEEIKKEIKKSLETNGNEDMSTQKSMGCHKSSAQRLSHRNTGLRQKEKKSQIDNLTHHLNELQKEEQAKPKVSRRKEIIKTNEEITKMEIKKIIDKISQTMSWFFENVNKIDKSLARLTKKRKEKTQ